MELDTDSFDEGWDTDCDIICHDCGQTLHIEATSWCDPDEAVSCWLSLHRSDDCRYWKNVLWRVTHHHGPIHWIDQRKMRRMWKRWKANGAQIRFGSGDKS